ncbi:unnamed protein product [Trifolium pratense]|uniref:Uncharacterized protein n=1 Tax=Trifolium pratense TaxID=57577 RepID=A0ACB0JN37_TRIPR|nr:unnamed protein product [Trifolium pratense]
MFPPPPKPPGHSFQLQVTRETAVLPPPLEPPDVEHIVVVLQGFATLMFPSLTGFRSLYRNGYRVTDSILGSLNHTVTSPLPPPEPPDMSYDTAVVMLTIAKHNLLCRPHANSHFWGFNRRGSLQHHVTWAWSQRIGIIALVGVVIIHQMIAKVLLLGTYIINFEENSAWTDYMLVILHDIEKNNIKHSSLFTGLYLMECIKSLLEKHEIIGLSLGLVLTICYEFNCVIGSKFFVLDATHGSVIHADRLFERYSNRDIVISSNFASYFFMVIVGLKIGNSTFFVFCLSDIHFSNYHVCHDVELVSTVAISHAKGCLQIPNESLDTKMRHQETQLYVAMMSQDQLFLLEIVPSHYAVV